jgi:hypothetical protein
MFDELSSWCCNPVQQTYTPGQHMSKIEFEIKKREIWKNKANKSKQTQNKQTNKQNKQINTG